MPPTKEKLDFSEDRALLWVPLQLDKADLIESRFSRKSAKVSPRRLKKETLSDRRNSDPEAYHFTPRHVQSLEKKRVESERQSSSGKIVTEDKMTRPQILKTNTFTLGDISENDDNMRKRQSIDEDELDYKSEVDVGDFTAKDIKVIVGRNRVRIIGERAFGSLEGTNGFHKVVQVPSNVDPLSLKSNLKDGKVVLTGKYAHKNRKWTINNRGLMTVKDDGCARITIDLPKGIDPSQVRVKTMTKHYLVVSNSPNADLSKSPSKPVNDDIVGDFIETFELPSDCDLKSLSKRTMGESTLVVEFGSQSSPTSKSVSSGAGHRPRSFTF